MNDKCTVVLLPSNSNEQLEHCLQNVNIIFLFKKFNNIFLLFY